MLTIYLHLPLSKQDYKLIRYNIQINEANSYAKFGISSFFKQPFNKIPLGIIILVILYGLPKQRTKRETKLWWSFSILTGMKKINLLKTTVRIILLVMFYKQGKS